MHAARQDPSFYNNDAALGVAIEEAVLAASVIKGWPRALQAVLDKLERAAALPAANWKHLPTTLPELLSVRRAAPAPALSAVTWRYMAPRYVCLLCRLLSCPPIRQVRSLSLRDMGLGSDGNAAASALLLLSSRLRSLDVAKNALDRDVSGGGRAVAKALAANRGLTQLNLASNEMSAESGLALCDAIRRNETLCDISFADNAFGDAVREKLKLEVLEGARREQLASSAAVHELPIEDKLVELSNKWGGEKLVFASSGRALDGDRMGKVQDDLVTDIISIGSMQEG